VLGFNLVEGEWRPISDVELLMGCRTSTTGRAELRRRAREGGAGAGLPQGRQPHRGTDIKNITDRQEQGLIGVEGNPAMPLTQDVMELAGHDDRPGGLRRVDDPQRHGPRLGRSDASRRT
jgi:hypothetical protein